MSWKKLSLMLPWLMLAAFVAYAAIQGFYKFHNQGKIHTLGVEVYWDASCTQPCTEIHWGWLYPGDCVSKTVYVKLSGNTHATLSMSVGNWNPSVAETYITVSWDYAGQVLDPNAVWPVTFTLSVSPSITGVETFEFDITITATG